MEEFGKEKKATRGRPRKNQTSFVPRTAEDIKDFRPQPRLPLPQPLRLRYNSQWWVRCVNNELTNAGFCHDSFLERNALSDKSHPCWNCPLGKSYRRLYAEDCYSDERVETDKGTLKKIGVKN